MNDMQAILQQLLRPPQPRVLILPDAAFDALRARHPTLERVRAVWPSSDGLPDRIVAHPSGRVMKGRGDEHA